MAKYQPVTMTVEELVEALQKYDPGTKVVVHSEVVEEQGFLQQVTEYSKDDLPYDKGDDVSVYNLPDEKFVFLSTIGRMKKVE